LFQAPTDTGCMYPRCSLDALFRALLSPRRTRQGQIQEPDLRDVPTALPVGAPGRALLHAGLPAMGAPTAACVKIGIPSYASLGNRNSVLKAWKGNTSTISADYHFPRKCEHSSCEPLERHFGKHFGKKCKYLRLLTFQGYANSFASFGANTPLYPHTCARLWLGAHVYPI
jgi:hypothetical protein